MFVQWLAALQPVVAAGRAGAEKHRGGKNIEKTWKKNIALCFVGEGGGKT